MDIKLPAYIQTRLNDEMVVKGVSGKSLQGYVRKLLVDYVKTGELVSPMYSGGVRDGKEEQDRTSQ